MTPMIVKLALLATAHGERDLMLKESKEKFANITEYASNYAVRKIKRK